MIFVSLCCPVFAPVPHYQVPFFAQTGRFQPAPSARQRVWVAGGCRGFRRSSEQPVSAGRAGYERALVSGSRGQRVFVVHGVTALLVEIVESTQTFQPKQTKGLIHFDGALVSGTRRQGVCSGGNSTRTYNLRRINSHFLFFNRTESTNKNYKLKLLLLGIGSSKSDFIE